MPTRTSSWRSLPSASTRATRSTSPTTPPRCWAASRPRAWRSRGRCTAASSRPSSRCQVDRRRRDGQAAREHLPRRQHRPRQRGGHHVRPSLGLDTWEVIQAAATKPFGFMPFYPGPGLGWSLHPHRSAVPVVEAQDAQVQRALHHPGRRDQLGDARAGGGAGGRRAQRTPEGRARFARSGLRASPTRRTSRTCASRPPSTSSSSCTGAAPRWPTAIRSFRPCASATITSSSTSRSAMPGNTTAS